MTGPIAVVIVSLLVLWVSAAPVSLIGILIFIAAALPPWLVLHLVQARLPSALPRHRSPWIYCLSRPPGGEFPLGHVFSSEVAGLPHH